MTTETFRVSLGMGPRGAVQVMQGEKEARAEAFHGGRAAGLATPPPGRHPASVQTTPAGLQARRILHNILPEAASPHPLVM